MRVIAGALGGRTLVAPKGHDTRPTTDRVREALFSVLGDVSGAVVLDLYAGTGALGIEALSRGASRAVFVENAKAALQALERNLRDLGLVERTSVSTKPVLRTVAGLSSQQPFDLVFADPPYVRVGEAAEALGVLVGNGAIAAGGRVVLEHASRDVAPVLKGLTFEQTRKYGDTSLSLYSASDVREDVSRIGADG